MVPLALCLAGQAIRLLFIYYVQRSILSPSVKIPRSIAWLIPPSMSRIESTLSKMLGGGLLLSFGYSFIILATLRYNGDPDERTSALFPTPRYREFFTIVLVVNP